MSVENRRFYKILAIVTLSLIVLIFLVLILLNNINKAKKISSINMSYPMVINNEKILYYSAKGNSINELNPNTNQEKVIKKLNAEQIFSFLWSPAGDQAIIEMGTKNTSIDKWWYFSIDKNIFVPLDEKMNNFAWSKSGKFIAYTNNLNNDESTINISNPDGKNNKTIYRAGESLESNEVDITWSNDEKNLAVSIGPTDVGSADSFVLNIASTTKSNITSSESASIGNWSPDSKKIVFELFSENENYKWAIKDLSTNKEKNLNYSGQILWLSDSLNLLANNNETVWKINGNNSRKNRIYQPKIKEKLPIDYIVKIDEPTKTLYFMSNNNLYKVRVKI